MTGIDSVTYGAAVGFTRKQIATLASGFRFKGSVPTYGDLPASADNGDVYIVEADHHKYAYYNGSWILNTDADVWGEIYGDIENQADLMACLGHVFEQATASDEWTIAHNMHYFPKVTVIDGDGAMCVGVVEYTNKNSLKVKFSEAIAGKAYLS